MYEIIRLCPDVRYHVGCRVLVLRAVFCHGHQGFSPEIKADIPDPFGKQLLLLSFLQCRIFEPRIDLNTGTRLIRSLNSAPIALFAKPVRTLGLCLSSGIASLNWSVLKTGIISEATGSAYIELQSVNGGSTKVICSCYGPRQTKKSMAFSENGILWCDYKYATFADQGARPRRAGQSERERFLSRSIEKALHEAVRLDTFPKAVLEIYILVLENDGGDFEAALTCASAAIADAGVEMFDLVTAVFAGLTPDGRTILDPRSCDVPKMKATVSLGFMQSRQNVTHFNMGGHASDLQMKDMVELCLDGCSQFSDVIRNALTLN